MRSESIRIGPDDPRYRAVVDKRFNKRFHGSPDYVQLVSSTDQVVSAVEEAVRERRRLAVTSGGHCLEGFVSDPEVRVVIDLSPMKRVYYDAERAAVAVEAGATVSETFRALFETWGVVLPLGEYPEIGMGGHVVGSAFGFLCRQLGPCDSSGTTGSGASETVTPIPRTPLSGPSWRSIVGSSGRSSSAV